MPCSKRFDFNPNLPVERRRLVMSIAPVDWAAEWLRPMPPNFKFVGPILSEPGKPLPADLEVSCPPRDQLSLPTFVEKGGGGRLLLPLIAESSEQSTCSGFTSGLDMPADAAYLEVFGSPCLPTDEPALGRASRAKSRGCRQADVPCVALQEFMQEAGDQGVLLIALGTVTETCKPL